MAFTLSDYAKKNVKETEEGYQIGTNRNKLFYSDETLILSTVDCYIKLNDDDFWQFIHANDYFTSHIRVFQIYFKRASEIDGEIEIWAEGNLAK